MKLKKKVPTVDSPKATKGQQGIENEQAKFAERMKKRK